MSCVEPSLILRNRKEERFYRLKQMQVNKFTRISSNELVNLLRPIDDHSPVIYLPAKRLHNSFFVFCFIIIRFDIC